MEVHPKYEVDRFTSSLFLPEILKGLGVTIRHFFSGLAGAMTGNERGDNWTVQYPEEPAKVGPRMRGAHRLNKDEQGLIKCVGCLMCQTVCPAWAINIVAEEDPEHPDKERTPKVFEIDMLRCIFCGYCEEACPCDAISLTAEFEIADETRESLVYDMDRLLGNFDRWKAGEIAGPVKRGY